jgi:hypothetical protein
MQQPINKFSYVQAMECERHHQHTGNYTNDNCRDRSRVRHGERHPSELSLVTSNLFGTANITSASQKILDVLWNLDVQAKNVLATFHVQICHAKLNTSSHLEHHFYVLRWT